MPLQIEAVYEGGVLRPLQPLNLREHEHVVVSVVKVTEPTGQSELATEYLRRVKQQAQAAGPVPGVAETRRRLSKISGSMAAEIIADRGIVSKLV
jgi:predicted DNA-binding antitoxin AbrB/MazE fold protein